MSVWATRNTNKTKKTKKKKKKKKEMRVVARSGARRRVLGCGCVAHLHDMLCRSTDYEVVYLHMGMHERFLRARSRAEQGRTDRQAQDTKGAE